MAGFNAFDWPCIFVKYIFRYLLEPDVNDYDEYHLLLNGSIFAPQHMPAMLAPSEHYCMEVVVEVDKFGEVKKLGLRPLICFAEGTCAAEIAMYTKGIL